MATSPRTRLTPEQRRSQLLDLGVRLFARRPLHEISIDVLAEAAGISRGLLYHYFGNIVGFQEAVVRRAAADLVAQTAPPPGEDPIERLLVSLGAYVDYVDANYEGYLSLVRGAKGGNETLAVVYDEARSALTDRIAVEGKSLVPDTPLARLVVRGWQAMVEEVVLAWKVAPDGVTRDEVVATLAGSLAASLEALSESPVNR